MSTAGSTTGWQGQIRHAGAEDAEGVAGLAAELAQSFAFSPESFRANYPSLLAEPGACLLLAADGHESLGYLLGFRHLTFYANGPVAWVEEVVVRSRDRGRGVGGALVSAFEQWAAGQGCALVALATRRAAPFYRAVGYEESAAYSARYCPASRGREAARRAPCHAALPAGSGSGGAEARAAPVTCPAGRQPGEAGPNRPLSYCK